MKANPMPAVVQFLAGLVYGIDVALAGGLKVALDADADPSEISFAGPGWRDTEVHTRAADGVFVDWESMRELLVMAAASQDLGLPDGVAARVPPDFEFKGSGIERGVGPKQFDHDVAAAAERSSASRIIGLVRHMGAAGIYFTRIVVCNLSRGHVFQVCSGGLNHRLAASGNFGRVMCKHYQVDICPVWRADRESTMVVGLLCMALVLLADRMELPRRTIGGLVVVYESRSYGANSTLRAFLSRPAGAQVPV